MTETIYDKIVRKEIESYPVWESEHYLAFLTPYPNTPGLTIVIPKRNPGDYVFNLDNDEYHSLMDAAQQVAKVLEKALDVKRVAMVFEGTGIAHVHAKLYPLYGALASQTDVWSAETEFIKEYRGYITTIEGPEMDADELIAMQKKIRAAQE
jgi:histidine triad (HIT) family protein